MNLSLLIIIFGAGRMSECYFICVIRVMTICTILVVISRVHRMHNELIIVYLTRVNLLGEILFILKI